MSTKKKSEKTSIAVAVWVLGLMGLLLLFVIKQNEILGVLQETEFFTKVFGKEPTFVSKFEKPVQNKKTNGTEPPITIISPGSGGAGTVESLPVEQYSETDVPVETEMSAQAQELTGGTGLWFIQIDRDGLISRKEVRRGLSKTNSPLTSAVQALLTGPSITDLEKGFVSLIPEGTKLLSASIVNRVATLSFSEEFEYNRYGVEGYLGQLAQIVYTATAFPTVDSVQFLIEGELREYLGGDGVRIGIPLSRESFR
ncbi:MAG: GerMN domain-containing protein [Treponema sp.]|jgi:spore germination protein GerM|nr:GerMN domain-containing protein [Treponema sp.]